MAKTSIRKLQGGAPKGGSTGQALVKNSGADYDYDWGTVAGGGSGGTKIDIQTTQHTVTNASAVTLYTVVIPGGILGTNNAIKYSVPISVLNIGNANSITVNATYGGVNIGGAFLDYTAVSGAISSNGYLEGWLIADGATNAQKSSIIFIGGGNEVGGGTQNGQAGINGGASSVGSPVDSTTSQNLIITATAGTLSTITTEGIIVEQIVSAGSGVLGAWSTPITSGVPYHALTAGFVVAWQSTSGSGGGASITIKTDSSATPSTVRQFTSTSLGGGGSFVSAINATCPVKGGDYVQVDIVNSLFSGGALYWIPFA